MNEPLLPICEVDDQDSIDRAEYEALTNAQRTRYDELGQDGGTHMECMLYASMKEI